MANHQIKSSIILIADFERSKRVVLPRSNLFQEHDDAKFCQYFRQSKIAIMRLLDEIITSCWQISLRGHYAITKSVKRP